MLLFTGAALMDRLLNGTSPTLSAIGRVNFLPALGLAAIPLWILTSGLGEEVGWRGYLLPALQRRRGALKATLLLWLVWLGWHAPFFFYVPSYREMGLVGVPELAFSLLAGAVLLTWLANGSGSLLMVILWHGLFNVFTASEAGRGSLAMGLSMAVIAAAVAILALARPSDLAGPRAASPARARADARRVPSSTGTPASGHQRGGQQHDRQVEQQVEAREDAGDHLQAPALGGQRRVVAAEGAGALSQGRHAPPEVARVNDRDHDHHRHQHQFGAQDLPVAAGLEEVRPVDPALLAVDHPGYDQD